jgi:hypothetical protein
VLSAYSKRWRESLLPLLGWNALCLAVPLWFYLQPSPEPSLARAVVLVFAGPAIFLAMIGNVASFLFARSVLGAILVVVTAVLFLIWLAAVLIS